MLVTTYAGLVREHAAFPGYGLTIVSSSVVFVIGRKLHVYHHAIYASAPAWIDVYKRPDRGH